MGLLQFYQLGCAADWAFSIAAALKQRDAVNNYKKKVPRFAQEGMGLP